MSYRIANVRFRLSDEQIYPVNCFRADLQVGQKVIVETPDQDKRFKVAVVESIEFKNWNCQNTLVCLQSEVIRSTDGTWTYGTDHLQNGQIHRVCDLEDRLSNSGWTRTFPRRRNTYRVIYALERDGVTAEIRLRKNGIDFRLGERRVNHWFYESGDDLLELCWSFAEQFRTQASVLDDHFNSRGRPFPRPTRSGNDLNDIYNAISGGSGDGAYLGDGIWMGPGGSMWDEGR